MMRPRDWHSLTGDGRLMILSGQLKKATEGVAHQLKSAERKLVSTRKKTDRVRDTHFLQTAGDGLVRISKNATKLEALASWRRQRKGLVRTRKYSDRARRTHFLETTERGTCQNTERKRQSEEHALPGDGRWRDLSGRGKKVTE